MLLSFGNDTFCSGEECSIPGGWLPVRFQHLRLVDTFGECRDKSESFWRELDAKRTRREARVEQGSIGTPVQMQNRLLSGCANLMLNTGTASDEYRYRARVPVPCVRADGLRGRVPITKLGAARVDFDVASRSRLSIRALSFHRWEAGRARGFLPFRLLAVVGLAFRGGLKFTEIIGIPPKIYTVDMFCCSAETRLHTRLGSAYKCHSGFGFCAFALMS
uniref:Uncharacterized protein n=1 Tax=Ananas comosus var. bracteatus TaxID=296719 RepID=A0A6V7QLH8_ANACO|nr:unnamed protein product [Ananas comosus var. bracteatus]